MAELKKTGACQRLVVTGCLAERYRDELKDQIPEIDALLGTGEVPEIVSALGSMGPGPRRDRGGQAPAMPMTLHRKAKHVPLGGREELPVAHWWITGGAPATIKLTCQEGLESYCDVSYPELDY